MPPEKTGPRRNNPAALKTKLLDSAEALFAEHGFDGVSVRDIVAHAGSRISALTYHFGSKDELFAQVVARRSVEYVRVTQDSLAAALAAAGPRPPTAEEIVRAYLEPNFRLAQTGGEGWQNYIHLVTSSMNTRGTAEALAPLWAEMAPAQKSLLDAFHAIDPAMSREDLNWAVYFIVAAAVHFLVGAQVADRQSGGLIHSADLSTVLDKAVPFFAAGFERLSQTGKDRA